MILCCLGGGYFDKVVHLVVGYCHRDAIAATDVAVLQGGRGVDHYVETCLVGMYKEKVAEYGAEDGLPVNFLGLHGREDFVSFFG